jgi:hypothetical protein
MASTLLGNCQQSKAALGARVSENMVCIIKQRLSISCITLEESKYFDGQQNQKSNCENREPGQSNRTSAFACQPVFNQRSRQTNELVGQKPALTNRMWRKE